MFILVDLVKMEDLTEAATQELEKVEEPLISV